jgi:hypothetical protein
MDWTASFHGAFSSVSKWSGKRNNVLITDAWCDSAGGELLTAHGGIGSGKQHYKLGQPWREKEQCLTLIACEAATGNVGLNARRP